MRRLTAYMLAALIVPMLTVPALAHDLGALSVSVTFGDDGRFRAEIAVDREHLPPGAADLPRAIGVQDLARRFLASSVFAFDGTHRQVRVDSTLSPADPAAAKMSFTLAGEVPAGARDFTFACRLPLGESYLRLANAGDEEPTGQWLRPGAISKPFALRARTAAMTLSDVIPLYLRLGFTHILPGGLDHILFVLGLFLLSCRLRPLLEQVTAFTLAHSITLALSMYGVVSVPARIVEPLIALSIVAVAVENIFVRKFHWRRTAIVFGFGLLHGMGFASVLTELGLPRAQFAPALVCFNIGVEAGQISVLLLAFLAVGAWFGARPWYRWRIAVPASAMIALIGFYWTIERVCA